MIIEINYFVIFLFILQFLVCSFINYLMFNGKNEKDFYENDKGMSIIFGIWFGLYSVIGVIIVFLLTEFGKGGLKL